MNAYDLSGYDAEIEYGCYCVERDLGALEHGIMYGPPTDYGTVGSGLLNVYSAGYAANVKNIARLKARIKKLKETRDARLVGIKWKERKRWIKQRYDRRIDRAQRRLDRIERVMKRRIAKRRKAGNELTRRQRRIQAALRSGRRRRRRQSPKQRRLLAMRRRTAGAAGLPGEDLPALPDGDADLRPAAGDLPEAGAFPEGSMDDGFYLSEEQPVYKQPWFLAVAGIAVIGGILYVTRKGKAA